MLEMLMQWYRRRFSDPEAIALLVILLAGFGIMFFSAACWPVAGGYRAGLSAGVADRSSGAHRSVAHWATSLVLILFVGILLLLVCGAAGSPAARDLPHPRYAGHAK